MIELINRIMELVNQIFGVMLLVLTGVCVLILCVVLLHSIINEVERMGKGTLSFLRRLLRK
jgi:flagellar biosynthesis protein FliQ